MARKTKQREYPTKMVMEFTEPKNKSVFMRAVLTSGDVEISYEGYMKESGRKKISVPDTKEQLTKYLLPVGYAIHYSREERKFYWSYTTRNNAKTILLSRKRWSLSRAAASDAIRHNKSVIKSMFKKSEFSTSDLKAWREATKNR